MEPAPTDAISRPCWRHSSSASWSGRHFGGTKAEAPVASTSLSYCHCCPDFHHVGIGVESVPGMWKQAQIKLFGKLPADWRVRPSARCDWTDNVAEIGLIVLIHAVRGNQGRRNIRILLTDILTNWRAAKPEPMMTMP